MVSFLQPLAFLGLLAALIPIIIHLRERRREVTLSLPTVRFILEAHRRTSRRLKLRRLLLLVARILMVLLLTLLLARPVIVRREALVNAARPASVVLVLDTSPSMEYTQSGATRGVLARRLAGELAAAVTANGETAAVTTAGGRALGFTRDPAQVRSFLDRAAPSPRPADLAGALNAAYRLLEGAAFPLRQIVLFTDLARPEWSAFRPEALVRPDLGVPVRIVDVGEGAPGWNRAVTALEAAAAGEEGVGRVAVTVESFGEVPPGTATLELELDGRVLARRVVESSGAGPRRYDFPLPELEDGRHQLAAVLDADPLPFDDRLNAVLDYGGQLKVLTVDGSPRGSLMGSETYFLRTALNPASFGEARRVDNTVVLPAQLTPGSLDAYRVIILANLRSLAPDTAAALAGWVERGGGLVIFAGDNYGAQEWSASFDGSGNDLLPLWPGEPAEPPAPGTLALVDRESPALTVFREPGSGDFSRAVFRRFAAPGPGGLKPGARVLLAFDAAGKLPVMVERPRGKGKVILFTSSADLDWNNLATQTVYLPLLQNSVRYLAGYRGLSLSPASTAGEPALLPLPTDPGTAALAVTTPAGTAAEARVERGADGSFQAVLAATDQPGFYVFQAGDAAIPLAVNITRLESDVRPAPAETLDALGRTLRLERVQRAREGFTREGLRGSIDPTPWLAALLLLLLLAEGLISVGLRPRAS